VVGLTGGIASGKSTVSKLFISHGIPLVDADVLARQVVEPGQTAYKKIVSYFGTSILHPDGTLNRPKLGEIVFNDEAKRKRLNAIVHPAVQWSMAREVAKHWLWGQKICVVDVPLLIEGGLWKLVGRVVLVYW
jgi:dephospho-CoA kinase